MESIANLQTALLKYLQKEEQYSKTGENSLERQRIRKTIQTIHQNIYELAQKNKQEIQSSISKSLWNTEELQHYLGIYQTQKGPYVIDSVIPINDTTLLLTAHTTPYVKEHHQSSYTNVRHDFILLKERKEGIFHYYEREFQTPEKAAYNATKKAILKMNDQNNTSHIVTLLQNKSQTLITSSADIPNFGCLNISGEWVLKKTIIPKKFTQVCMDSKKTTLPITPQYFNYLNEEGLQINLLNAETKYRIKSK